VLDTDAPGPAVGVVSKSDAADAVVVEIDDGVGESTPESTRDTPGSLNGAATIGSSNSPGDGESAEPLQRKPRHFPCFDGLRAIAAVAILMVHTSWASGFTLRSPFGPYMDRLDVAVQIFFCISGFLLYRPFVVSHMSSRPAPSATKFWGRRLLRIIPAYWLALTVLTYGFHIISVGRGWQGVVADYGFLQIYLPTQSFTGITQAWTLCTEMSFYLMLPIYAKLLAIRKRSPNRQLVRELAGVVVLIVGSNLFRWWALNIPFWKILPNGKLVAICYPHCLTQPAIQGLYTNWLPSFLDTFGIGMLLAILSAWIVQRGKEEPAWLRSRLMPWISWAIAGGLFIAVSHLNITRGPLYFATPTVNLLRQGLEGVSAFFLLFPAVFGPQDRSLIRRFLSSWPIASLGVVSYGLYLWHLDLISLFLKWTGYNVYTETKIPLWHLALPVLGMSIVAGTISYFIVEKPALNVKNRIGWWGNQSRRRAPEAASSPPSASPTA
jgi:peptidoglycan/LPS O-acetylase OafA/YrhL